MNPISPKVQFVTNKLISAKPAKIILLKIRAGLGRFKPRKS